MIEFLLGMLFSGILIACGTWIDVMYMNNRGIKFPIKKRNGFIMACCWELCFFITGIIIGSGFK